MFWLISLRDLTISSTRAWHTSPPPKAHRDYLHFEENREDLRQPTVLLAVTEVFSYEDPDDMNCHP